MLPCGKRKAAGPIELLPDLIEGFGEVVLHPRLRLVGKLQRGFDPVLPEERCRLRSDAPDLLHRELAKR